MAARSQWMRQWSALCAETALLGTDTYATIGHDGAALRDARRRKTRKYPEFRCQLVLASMEVGGRWSEEAWAFLQMLAEEKARAVPALLRRATVFSFMRRWSTILAVAAHSALPATLLGDKLDTKVQASEWETPLGVLSGEGTHVALEPSGLPLRA